MIGQLFIIAAALVVVTLTLTLVSSDLTAYNDARRRHRRGIDIRYVFGIAGEAVVALTCVAIVILLASMVVPE